MSVVRTNVKVSTGKGGFAVVFNCKVELAFLNNRNQVLRVKQVNASALSGKDALQLALLDIEEWAEANRDEVRTLETGLVDEWIANKVSHG